MEDNIMFDDQSLNPIPAAQAILDESASAIPVEPTPASPAVAPSVGAASFTPPPLPQQAPIAPMTPPTFGPQPQPQPASPAVAPSVGAVTFPTPPAASVAPVVAAEPVVAPVSPVVAPSVGMASPAVVSAEAPSVGAVAAPAAEPVVAPVVTTSPSGSTTSVYEGKGMGKYKVVVIKDKCIGAASCIAVAPRAFKLDDQQIAEVINSVGQETDDNLLLAAQSCPTLAIEVYDTTTGEKVWPK